MIIDLTNAFGIPPAATNITYGNGDCNGDNTAGPAINTSTGVVDFAAAADGVALWYFVTFDLPGDNIACSPNNCIDLSVTPDEIITVEFDETSPAFVGGFLHVCASNGGYTLDGSGPVSVVANIIPASPFNGTYEMTYTEYGSPIIYNLCSGNFVVTNDTLSCGISFASIVDNVGGDNSLNDNDQVSGMEITVEITPDTFNDCSDSDTIRLVISPEIVFVDPPIGGYVLDCAALSPTFGTALDFDLYEFLIAGADPFVNTNPGNYGANAYGVSGEHVWLINDFPPCLMAQLDFDEAALNQLSADSFEILFVPLAGSSIRSLNLTTCSVDGIFTLSSIFTFSTGYQCINPNVYDVAYTLTNCPVDLTCYEVPSLTNITALVVDFGSGPTNIFGEPQFACTSYAETDCLRAQLIEDINEWLTDNLFTGTATLINGLMGVDTLRIVDTNIEFISITNNSIVTNFTDVGEGCLVCEPGNTFFFDELPDAGTNINVAFGSSINLFTDHLNARFPDAPNNGNFIIDASGGGVDNCGTVSSNFTGTPLLTNNPGGAGHGDLDFNDVPIGSLITISYEFQLNSTGCDMCIAFYFEVV